eukprot:TRINITY_DN4675_c1_g1_i1.p1 TRINITY_DN4675_c1_g1~~TRINITY_DN4675_c1_g1_i1.p1  ORF type:complete len:694 (-),score=34.21 TRINITY_DN4675_c1_g1_i1:191-2272(-)
MQCDFRCVINNSTLQKGFTTRLVRGGLNDQLKRKTKIISGRRYWYKVVINTSAAQKLNIHHGQTLQSENQQQIRRPLRSPLDNEYLLGQIWQQKKLLGISIACAVTCSICTVISPYITGKLIDVLAGTLPLSAYPKLIIALAIVYTIEPLATAMYISTIVKANERVMRVLRAEVFRNLLMQKIQFFDQFSQTKLTGLIQGELEVLRRLVFGNVSRDRGIRAVLDTIGGICLMISISWKLGPIIALVTVSLAVSTGIYKQISKSQESLHANSTTQMNEVASEVIANIKTVRSFGTEALERESFGEFSKQSLRSGVKLGRAKAMLEALTRGAIHLSIVILFAYGGRLVMSGQIPLGTLVQGLGYIYTIMFASQGLTQTYMDVRKSAAALERIRDVLNAIEPDVNMSIALPPGAWWKIANQIGYSEQARDDGAGLIQESQLKEGDLQLKNVYFTYPLRQDAHVLKGISLTLECGKVTALVGHSGAGKSTIGALISRFYQPHQGQITLAGVDIQSFGQHQWCKMVSMVSQEPVLFSGTVGDNIAYGKFGNASQKEIEVAAKAANAHDFIMKLPQQYQTHIGVGGGMLSGGQRQRVALARALLKDSPIIILDEATSALDATNEKLVRQAVERLILGKTVLVIAHRLSTIQNADKIVVVENGQIVEEGNHDQLIEKAGKYVELVCSQDIMWSGQFACLV